MKKTIYNKPVDVVKAGTPNKNELINMKKHNDDYNKKHPHALSFFGGMGKNKSDNKSYLNKNAGNVELNNYIFNHSVKYDSAENIPAQEFSNSFISDATSSEISGDFSGEASMGESIENSIEKLSINEAWSKLNESETLNEISLKDIGQKLKNAWTTGSFDGNSTNNKNRSNNNSNYDNINNSSNPSNTDIEDKNVKFSSFMPKDFSGVVIFDNKNKEVYRKSYIRTTVMTTDDAQKFAEGVLKYLPKSEEYYAHVYFDGKLIYDSKNALSSDQENDLIIYKYVITYDENNTPSKKLDTTYSTVKYNYKNKNFTYGQNGGKSLDIGNIDNSDVLQYICNYLYNDSNDSISDGKKTVEYEVTVDDKLVFNTEKPSSTDMGKLIANNNKRMAQKNKEVSDYVFSRANQENYTYVMAIIKVAKTKKDSDELVTSIQLKQPLTPEQLSKSDLITNGIDQIKETIKKFINDKHNLYSFEIYVNDNNNNLIYQQYSQSGEELQNYNLRFSAKGKLKFKVNRYPIQFDSNFKNPRLPTAVEKESEYDSAIKKIFYHETDPDVLLNIKKEFKKRGITKLSAQDVVVLKKIFKDGSTHNFNALISKIIGGDTNET